MRVRAELKPDRIIIPNIRYSEFRSPGIDKRITNHKPYICTNLNML